MASGVASGTAGSDPTLKPACFAAAHPAWRFEVAEGVGHVPQLEVPEWTAGHLLDWLDREGSTARDVARHHTPG